MRFIRLIQTALLLATALASLLYLRFYGASLANDYAAAFERQSFSDFANGDVYALARRFGALERDPRVLCIVGKRDRSVFYQTSNGNCSTGIFRYQITVSNAESGVNVSFTIGLPRGLLIGFFTYLLIQTALAIGFFVSSIRATKKEMENELKTARLAEQVAHDIRSPLAALETALRASSEISNETREILEAAATRIKRIAEELLYWNEGSRLEPKLEPVNLAGLLKKITAQKSIEFSAKKGLKIEESVDEASLNAACLLHEETMLRILSNIINNAAESMGVSGGEIKLRLAVSDNCAKINIEDTGHGIPPKILRRLGRARGLSFGKEKGRGLGVYHARSNIEHWGGEFRVNSKLGIGTIVSIALPTLKHDLSANQLLDAILVDDDHANCKTWELAARAKSKRLITFNSPRAFLECIHEFGTATPIYLDHDLGAEMNGLELAKKLNVLGFTRIYLSTGYSKEKFKDSTFLAGVISKVPPWLS